jgi:hypothetical protein
VLTIYSGEGGGVSTPQVNFEKLIEKYIEIRKSTWTKKLTSNPWWAIWRKTSSVLPMTRFLIDSLDQLILYFAQYNEMAGADKKALVMVAIGELYDYLSAQCFPLWLKAVSPMLKSVILSQVISPSIDWIVAKYKDSVWNTSSSAQAMDLKPLF